MRKSKITSVNRGISFLIYGDTGVGKTTTTLLTAPEPVAYVMLEPRDLSFVAGILKDRNIDIFEPEDFWDFIRAMEDYSTFKDYQAIVIDSMTYLCNVMLLTEIEKETAEAKVFDTSKRKLVNLVRTDLSGYGAIGSWMNRITTFMGNYVKQGKYVVGIALATDNPKWNVELACAPNFIGEKFNKSYPAWFDCIGLVRPRVKDGKVVYPPAVYFESDGTFVAKWTGPNLDKKAFPYDLSKIIKVIKGGK